MSGILLSKLQSCRCFATCSRGCLHLCCCPTHGYQTSGMGNCSASCLAAGGPSSGLFSHAHKSLKRKSCWRSRAARLESDQPKLNFICRYFKISMAINAVQIRVLTAYLDMSAVAGHGVAQPICGKCATAQGKQRGVAQLFQTECATATGVLGCHASRRRAKKMAWEIRGANWWRFE